MVSNRPVGLWMLPAHIGSSRSALGALQREFARVRTLEHPHIARLLELGCNGSQYYVTGERLDGEPLREVLAHLLPERLEVNEADDIVRAIGSALIYAHERGVAHGDVRPENVLVTMDRRFVLTNFLARRLAKVAGQPPRPADDVRGLARLAAELYTGMPSVQALRGASDGGVPPARLTAIRAVLESAPNRRTSSVADFLANAGLAARAGATARRTEPQRSWSLWRLVVPTAAVVAVGTLLAAYHAAGGDWRESAIAIQQRGLEALRAVTARHPAPPSDQPPTADTFPAPPSSEPQSAAATPAPGDAPGASANALPDRADAPSEPPASAPAPATSVPDRDVAPAPPPAPAIFTAAVAKTPARARPERDPAVLSLGLARIAAREDHSVVAIEVLRSGDTTREATVGWWTTPDTAHVEDDYVDVGRQTLAFPAGATVQRLLIPLVNDGVREADEVFTVHLGAPRGGVTGAVTATRVTLHDDD